MDRLGGNRTLCMPTIGTPLVVYLRSLRRKASSAAVHPKTVFTMHNLLMGAGTEAA